MIQHHFSVLANGLPVVRIPMPSVASVTVLALANTGSRYETAKVEGIAHFFEHMVFKGTARYPEAQDLAAAVDSVGADFNAFTSKEYTGYYVRAAAEHVGLALDVVSDMLLTPQLRQEDIDRERGVIIEEMNMYADTPARHISDIFDRLMFAGTGLGHDIIGTKDTIQQIQADDFRHFLSAWYGLGNLVLVVAGAEAAVNSPKLLNQIERAFSKDTTGTRAAGKVDVSTYFGHHGNQDTTLELVEKKTEQAHFILGFPGIDRFDRRRYALSLLSTVLGGNMSSRLFTEVREKRGLCYYVHSDVDLYHETGVVGASAGVDPKRVEEALRVILQEFAAVATEQRPITASELQKAKDYIVGKTILGLEDSEHVAQFYGMKQLLVGEIETPEEVLTKIKRVKLEDVHAVAAELFQLDRVRLAVIGPYQDRSLFEKILKAS